MRGRTWGQLRREASWRLGSDPEARWLVEAAAGGPLAAVSHLVAAGPAIGCLESMLRRRAAGEPVQYIAGRWAFRGLELAVDRRVMIPRPETEQVVDAALEALDGLGEPSPVVVDLGTGSGAIALAIASERPGTRVWGSDVSEAALEVAASNLATLPATVGSRVRLVAGSWWEALPKDLAGRVDLVVSNPPYVSSGEICGLDAEVTCFEPRTALEAGPTGLEALALVIQGAREWLRPGGAAVVEIAPHQAQAALSLAGRAGLVRPDVRRDLAGRERALVGRAPAGGADGGGRR